MLIQTEIDKCSKTGKWRKTNEKDSCDMLNNIGCEWKNGCGFRSGFNLTMEEYLGQTDTNKDLMKSEDPKTVNLGVHDELMDDETEEV